MHIHSFRSPAPARLLFALLSIGWAATAQTSLVKGRVESGGIPVSGASTSLYLAGDARNAPAQLLATTTTDSTGTFQLSFTAEPDAGSANSNAMPSNGDSVFYLVAVGGHATSSSEKAAPTSPIAFATVLGNGGESNQNVVLNERTTVATAWAMAQFAHGFNIAGTAPGLPNAAATLRNLVDISTGEVGSVLANPPNGMQTSTLAQFNSLANLLSLCTSAPDGPACAGLLSLATPPGGVQPANMLEAALDIAHNPTHHAAALYQLSATSTTYAPALTKPPAAWILALKYVGNGHEFDGPGNMAVDGRGNLWITNNYDGAIFACGGKQLLQLTPTGEDAPGAPFRGGGINGAGFGISLDPNDHVWVGNFGFKGVGCSNLPLANSVSAFDLNGVPLSPSSGYTGGGTINSPQGTQSDYQGNIWIANYGTEPGVITEFVKGNPNQVKALSNLGLSHPFDIAVDAHGNLWVTSVGNNKVVEFDSNGSVLASYSGAFSNPLAIAIDSLGNAWVTNLSGSSITEIDTQGATHVFRGGGVKGPWGIAVDGNDNIWVADFVSQAVSEFCGARVEKCPEGLKTGDPISPGAGFTSEATQRLTGIVVDPSGNLWTADNWKHIPIPTNPGGSGMMELIGIGAPVKAPRIGPPQQP